MTGVLVSRLGEIARTSIEKGEQAVAKAALDVEASAKLHVVQNRTVDTGNMLGSIQAEPTGVLEAEVTAGVDYAHFVEFGTVHPARTYRVEGEGALQIQHVSKAYTIPARPFMTPAAEEVRPSFERAIRDIYDA